MRARTNLIGEFLGNYEIQFIDHEWYKVINGQLVSEWLFADAYLGDFKKPFWNGIEWTEGLSVEEIQLIESKKINDNEYQLYCKRQQDGIDAYLKISAEFRLAKLSGTISEAEHSFLEDKLMPVRNEVMFGQWINSLKILESIGFAQVGPLYDRLHLQISAYISENY